MKLFEITSYAPKLKWAVGSDRSHARGYPQLLQSDPKYVLIWVNIRDAFRLGSEYSVLNPDHPRGGPNAIGMRVDQAKQYWADGGYMNPSICAINAQGEFD